MFEVLTRNGALKQMIKCFTYSPLFHLTSTWHYSHDDETRPYLSCTTLPYVVVNTNWKQQEENRLGQGVRNEEGIWSAEAISTLLKMCMAQSLGRYGGISSPDSVFISLWWYLSQLCNIWGWWFLLASFPGPHPAPHQLSGRGPGRFSYVSDGTDWGNYLIM